MREAEREMSENSLTEEELIRLLDDEELSNPEWLKAHNLFFEGLTEEEHEIKLLRWTKEEELEKLQELEGEERKAQRFKTRDLNIEVRELRKKDLLGTIEDMKRDIKDLNNIIGLIHEVIRIPGY